MCGRYLFWDQQNEYLAKMIEQARKKLPEPTFKQLSLGEVFPQSKVMVGIFDSAKKMTKLEPMVWGYPQMKKILINARSESMDSLPTFQNNFHCVIPCCGYYEWSKEPKKKYYFTIENPPMFLAGLWKSFQVDGSLENRFVILTQEASYPEQQIHNRQPIVLNLDQAHLWCKGSALQSVDSSIPRTMQEV